jgi:hypothetical protein
VDINHPRVTGRRDLSEFAINSKLPSSSRREKARADPRAVRSPIVGDEWAPPPCPFLPRVAFDFIN